MGIFGPRLDMGKNTEIQSFASREDYLNKKTCEKNKKEINTIIEKVRGMDGDYKTLTLNDFINARMTSIFGKDVTIRIDGNAGLATVQLANGHINSFDFETKEEKQERVVKELEAKYGNRCEISASDRGVQITVNKGKKVKLIDLTSDARTFVDKNPQYYNQEENQMYRSILRKDGHEMSEGEVDFVINYCLEPEQTFFIPYTALNAYSE